MKWQLISPGGSIFIRRLSKMFGIEWFKEPTGQFDGLIMLGIWENEGLEVALKYPDLPKILIWSGSDAKFFQESKKEFNFERAIHITDTPWLVYPLHKYFNDICFVPLPVYMPFDWNIPMPRKPGILIYAPKHHAQDVARLKTFVRQARGIPIHVLTKGDQPIVDKRFQNDVHYHESVKEEDRADIFRQVNVLVKLMKHDAMSQTVVEMKCLKRHVFWTTRAPYCRLIEPGLRMDILARMVRNPALLRPDAEGAKYYHELHTPAMFLKMVKELCSKKGWVFNYDYQL